MASKPPTSTIKFAYIVASAFKIGFTLFMWWLIYFTLAKLVHPLAGWAGVAVVVGYTAWVMWRVYRLRQARRQSEASPSPPSDD